MGFTNIVNKLHIQIKKKEIRNRMNSLIKLMINDQGNLKMQRETSTWIEKNYFFNI